MVFPVKNRVPRVGSQPVENQVPPLMQDVVPNQFDIGIAGLDFPGRQLARSLAGQGWSVAAFDKHVDNIKATQAESPAVRIASNPTEFMGPLRRFRTVIVAGNVFEELSEQLEAGDLLIDAENYFFRDCARRGHLLTGRGVRYLEIGIIRGGKEGRRGPVLMAGGRFDTFQSALPFLEAMGSVGYLGPGASGHFVKMIHDGIEFALAHLFQETSDLLKRALAPDAETFGEALRLWPMGEPPAGQRDDAARWTSQAARELGLPIPTIDAAAGVRVLSEFEKRNDFATTLFRQPVGRFGDDKGSILEELRGALLAAVLITYAQGLSVLTMGSQRYGLQIAPVEVLRLWKICRVRRAPLLDELAAAAQATPGNLLHDADLSEKVMEEQECLRQAVWRAKGLHMPVPALMASLDYLDACRHAWLPVNLIDVAPARHAAMPPLPAALARR